MRFSVLSLAALSVLLLGGCFQRSEDGRVHIMRQLDAMTPDGYYRSGVTKAQEPCKPAEPVSMF